jgi:hypothetical protein
MTGWIKLHRKFLQWEWFTVDEMVKLFIYLLLSANHEDGNFQGVEVKRGQVITGLNKLSFNTGISIQTLRTCLKRLEKTSEINIQSTNKFSIITICNYDTYQSDQQATNKQPNKPLTSNQQATNKQLTTNKNDNNIENENNDKNILSFEALKQNKILNFKNSLSKFKDKYPIELLKEFFEYWTESDINGKGKMRFEDEKYFDFGRRLGRWKKNNDKINHNYSSNGTPKPSKNGSYD